LTEWLRDAARDADAEEHGEHQRDRRGDRNDEKNALLRTRNTGDGLRPLVGDLTIDRPRANVFTPRSIPRGRSATPEAGDRHQFLLEGFSSH
jgi:hypothetical protein